MTPFTTLLIILSISVGYAIPAAQYHPLPLSEASEVTLLSSVHTWNDGGPCKRNDFVCMNKISLVYVNQIRGKKSRKPLTQGTKSMLKVAMDHSKRMSRDFPSRKKKKEFPVFHQDLGKTKLLCNSFFSGENVGQNFLGFGKKPTDPAKTCITQFKKSKPHYKNMMHPKHEAVVLGVYIDRENYIWCTQIFSVITKFTKTGKCKKLDTWKGKSLKFSSREHMFKKLSFVGRFPNGLIDKMVLKCRNDHCQYCQEKGSICLTEENSIRIDIKYFD